MRTPMAKAARVLAAGRPAAQLFSG
jgi:hypothetical protein